MNSNFESALLVLVKARTGESTGAALKLKTWSPLERRVRASKVFIGGLMLTLGFVFLPIAHFILVPLGLIITPLVSFKMYRLKQVVLRQTLLCPKCNHAFEFPFSFGLIRSIEVQCDACREVLMVSGDPKSLAKYDPKL